MTLSELFVICILSVSAQVASSRSSALVNSTWFAGVDEIALEVPLSVTESITENVFRCGFLKGSCTEECYIFATYVSTYGKDNSLITWRATTDFVPRNSTLHFGLDGNLVVQHPNGLVLWESRTGNEGVDTMELLNSQSLVLHSSNKPTISWDSLDHPTDILIPTQNLRVGQSLNNPPYSLQVQPYRVVLQDTRYVPPQPYGAWTSQYTRIKSLEFDDTKNSLFILDEVSNVINRTDFKFTPNGSRCGTTSLLVTDAGNLAIVCYSDFTTSNVQLDNAPDASCRPPVCGPFGICSKGLCNCPKGKATGRNYSYESVDKNDPSKGCMLPGERNISTSLVDFLELPGIDLISASYIPATVMSYEDCKLLCMKNSSCIGFTFKSSSSSCQTSPIMLLVNTSEPDVTTFLAINVPSSDTLPPLSLPSKTRRRLLKTTISVLAVTGFSVIVLLISLHKMLCSKATKEEKPQKELFFPNLPKRFTLAELSRITGEFQNKIGQGGYSTVYQGVLLDGCTKVAVKCLEGGPKQSQKQFEAEVMTIGSIHHKNLVKLLGYGASNCGNYYYLVYEFLQNFSLDGWLFNGQGAVLSWKKRVEIALDIASGLCYLHHGCSLKVLHLDIKPQNVVLDAHFKAKICDFGLAKQVDTGQSVQTMARGTPGYMAPEWLYSKVSEKADVYSFGLLLLELVSGQKTVWVPTCMSMGSVLGLKTIQNALDTDVLELVVDARLLGSFNPRQLQKMVELGISCTNEDPSKRPTMQLVVNVLEDVSLDNIS